MSKRQLIPGLPAKGRRMTKRAQCAHSAPRHEPRRLAPVGEYDNENNQALCSPTGMRRFAITLAVISSML